MTEEQIKELKKSNYVRAAQHKTDYWLDFSKTVLENYILKFDVEFNLVVYSKIENEEEFYIIPFSKVQNLFKKEFLAKDEKRGSNKRWVANIKNHIFKITNCSEVVDLKDYYCNNYWLVPFGNKEEENDYAIEDKRQEINVRLRQSEFRSRVLENFNSRCCISGIGETDLLVASHIIPWSHNKKVRLDPSNGLCLFIVYDKLFDKGYFTLTEDYTIRVVEKKIGLSKKLVEILEIINGTKISLSKNVISLGHLKYHRENIFMDRQLYLNNK